MGRLTRLVLPVSEFDLKKGTSLFSPPLFFLSPSAVRNTSIPLIYFNRFPNNSGSQKWLSLLEKKLDYHHLNLVISDNSPRQDIPDLFISRHSFQLWILKKEEKKKKKEILQSHVQVHSAILCVLSSLRVLPESLHHLSGRIRGDLAEMG